MRLDLVVLVAVIALVSRCIAVSATSSANQINLSKLNQALDTAQNHAGDGNRFFRSAKIVDDSYDDIDSDDEERGGKTWSVKFAWWRMRGKTADDIYKKYKLEPLVRRAYYTGHFGQLKQNKNYQKWIRYSVYLKERGLN